MSEKLSKFKVDIKSYCTNSYREPEEYGDWGEEYDNSLASISLGDFEYPDVLSSLDFSKTAEVYVVWVEYSYGDSFGRADGAGTEVVGVFKDADSAYELEKAIENDRPDSRGWDDENKYRLHVQTSDGQVFNFYTGSWHDYFGGLDHVHVDKKVLQKV